MDWYYRPLRIFNIQYSRQDLAWMKRHEIWRAFTCFYKIWNEFKTMIGCFMYRNKFLVCTTGLIDNCATSQALISIDALSLYWWYHWTIILCRRMKHDTTTFLTLSVEAYLRYYESVHLYIYLVYAERRTPHCSSRGICYMDCRPREDLVCPLLKNQ